MPSLPRPYEKVLTQWGGGVLDFQYVLTKEQKEEGKTATEADMRLLLKPDSRATRRTAVRISSGSKNVSSNNNIYLTSSQTMALLDNQEGLAHFLHSHYNLPKKQRLGVLHEKYLKTFFFFQSSSVSTNTISKLSTVSTKKKLSSTLCVPKKSPSVLRKAVSHKSAKGLRGFCDCKGHVHAPLDTETMVVDHILELQLLHSLNQTIQLPEQYLKKVANESWNLQMLGSLQNRAKAWVVLKYLQRKETKSHTSRCDCLRCVATSLLPRENLRCAGSLRSLAHKENFDCLVLNFTTAWKSFLAKILAGGFTREHLLFEECSEHMLTCFNSKI